MQDKTVKQVYSGVGKAQALPWANVPLFKPAVAVLACAVVAVGVLALVDSQKQKSEESLVGQFETQFKRFTFWPGFPVIASRTVGEETFSLSVFAEHSYFEKSAGVPAKRDLRFVDQKVATDNKHYRVLRIGSAEQFVKVSFEFSDSISLTARSATAFNSERGGIGFLPAPTKPRLFKNSAAAAAIQLPLPKPARKPSRFGPMSTVAALDAHFDRLDYDLSNLRKPGNHVPRVYLDKLPEDIAEEKSVTLRKRVFIKSILPVVLRVNEDILATRQKLQNLRRILDSGMSLMDEQRNWLYQIAERYETDPYDWDAFMERVDIVPPSLAIAQAAEESGWGTSRFAREGNALFGQYTYKSSNGMLPEERPNGRRHLIRTYTSLIDGVHSYIHNLNYHRAYTEFRAARKWLRNHDKPIDGHTLAGELIRYSERGADYVRTLRHIMRANELSPLDHARLHEDRWTQGDTVRGGQQS